MSEQPVITMAEAHSAGICAKGQRAWLNKNVPNWKRYIVTQGGFPVEVAREWNPALVERVLKLREARDNG